LIVTRAASFRLRPGLCNGIKTPFFLLIFRFPSLHCRPISSCTNQLCCFLSFFLPLIHKRLFFDSCHFFPSDRRSPPTPHRVSNEVGERTAVFPIADVTLLPLDMKAFNSSLCVPLSRRPPRPSVASHMEIPQWSSTLVFAFFPHDSLFAATFYNVSFRRFVFPFSSTQCDDPVIWHFPPPTGGVNPCTPFPHVPPPLKLFFFTLHFSD